MYLVQVKQSWMCNTQRGINLRCVATIQILYPFAFKIERCLFIYSKHSNTTINLRESGEQSKKTLMHHTHTNKDSISKIKSCQFGWLLLVLLSFYFNIQTAIWYRLMGKSEKQIIIQSETYWISPFPFLLFVYCLFFFRFFSVSFFSLTASIRRHWYSGLNLGITTNSHTVTFFGLIRIDERIQSFLWLSLATPTLGFFPPFCFSIHDYYVFVSSIPIGKRWIFF